jgi:hypothetical protein
VISKVFLACVTGTVRSVGTCQIRMTKKNMVPYHWNAIGAVLRIRKDPDSNPKLTSA